MVFEDREKIVFNISLGLYYFIVMFFGLVNLLFIFECLMENVFRGL